MHTLAKVNPVSALTKQRIGIGITLLLGALAVYLGLRPSTAPTASGTIVLQNGDQPVTLLPTGLTLTLPPGGTWLTIGTVGTSTPVFLPGTTFSAGTGTFPITWSLNGATQTTNLTVTVP
jgi:hypothetical protein